MFAEEWNRLNPDPFFHNPSKGKDYWNPHVSPAGETNETITAAGGYCYITFSQGLMKMNISNPLEGEKQFGILVAGAFLDHPEGWLYRGELGEDDRILADKYKLKITMSARITNASTNPNWLRAGIAVAVLLKGTSTDRFVEQDFYRREKPIGTNVNPSNGVVLLQKANVSLNQDFMVTLETKDYLDNTLQRYFGVGPDDYKIWGVWIAVETIKGSMVLEVYRFEVLYAKKTAIELLPSLINSLIISIAIAATIIIAMPGIKKLVK